MSQTIQLVFVGAMLPWVAYIMVRPRFLVMLTIVLSLIQLSWFTRYFGAPAVLNRASLAVAGFLGIRLFFDFVIKKRNLAQRRLLMRPVLGLTIFFLTLTFISGVNSGENMLLGIYELRYYYFGFVCCFGLYYYFNDILSIPFFKRAMIWIGIIQLPFTIIKWFSASGGTTRTLDSVSGSFGGYGELVGCQILAISIVLFEEFTTKEKIVKWNNYIICLVLIVPLLLSKSRTATLYVIMAIFFTWFVSALQRKNFAIILKQAVPVIIGGCFIISLFYLFFWKNNYNIVQQFNVSYVKDYFMKDPVISYQTYMEGVDPIMGRVRALIEATKLVSKDIVSFLIGYGSGATVESSFLKVNGQYFQWYGPLAGLGRNHFSKTIAEFGFLGLGAFVVFFIVIYKRIKKLRPSLQEVHNLMIVLLFTLTILSVYTITLTSYFFSLTVAFFIATVQVEIDRIIDG